MRHARHILHKRREDVAPRPQVRLEVKRLVKMMIHIALGRTAPDQDTITIEQIPAVTRDVHRQRCRR